MMFNINNKVRVRLTDVGRAAMVENHKRLYGVNAGKFEVRTAKESDGWSEWQLWDLMREFGPHIHMAGPTPFETTIEIVDDQS